MKIEVKTTTTEEVDVETNADALKLIRAEAAKDGPAFHETDIGEPFIALDDADAPTGTVVLLEHALGSRGSFCWLDYDGDVMRTTGKRADVRPATDEDLAAPFVTREAAPRHPLFG